LIGGIPVGDVSLADVERAVAPLEKEGHLAVARVTQAHIHAVLDHAVERGWRAETIRSKWSPLVEFSNGPKAHHPMLGWREAPTVVAKLRANNSVSARLIEFLILTAVRLSEARHATFGEFDLNTATWIVPAARTKMRSDHVVPLSHRAVEIIREIAAVRVNDLVFPGWRDGRPISRMTVWSQCQRMTSGRASPHGFRATFATWCDDHGVAFEVSETALAHVGGVLKQAYKRSDLRERRRKVMNEWATFLNGVVEADVVFPWTARAAS
jgi:integrase